MIKFSLLFILSALTSLPALADFAWDTQIKMANGKLNSIQNIRLGEEIADLDSKSTMNKMSQGSSIIGFSSGSSNVQNQNMMYIDFGSDSSPQSIVVSLDQVFLTASGKFKRTKSLNPGIDQLLSETGVPLSIHSLRVGEYRGGIQNISSESVLSPDNCFVANGVWVGSYMHQTYWDYGMIENANIFDDFPLNR